MAKKLPILVTIPHASTFVPANIRKKMTFKRDYDIRKQSDLYTDDIFEFPKVHNVKAKCSRLVVDVNRAPDDIEVEYKLYHDGVVVSVDEFGDKIYEKAPEMEGIFERVAKYHEPFHDEIERIAAKKKIKFLIDGHSLWNIGPATRGDSGAERAEIVLGNREFTTCSREATLKISKFFKDRGYTVAINEPYQGKYLIAYHCSRKGLPGIQLEVNRKLYMNETTLAPKKRGIAKVHKDVSDLLDMLAEEVERYENMGKKFA